MKKIQEKQFVKVCGAFDVMSAKLAEMNDFDAIWASGFGISSARALPDAGIITMTELLDAVTFMAEACSIPVIADCDTGYGGPNNVAHLVKKFENAGIAGICIEDKTFPKENSLFKDGKQEMISKKDFVAKLIAAKNAKKNPDFVIIGRTEALIADLGVEEALDRATAYEKAGADIIFVHSRKKNPDEIFEFYEKWKGKTPLMAVPTAFPTVALDELKSRGVQMVVFAHQTTLAAFAAISDVVKQMSKIKSLSDLNTKLASMDDLFKLQGMHKIRDHENFIEEEVKKLNLD
ncbi:MAG: isocitrate lyase/phosphoenolpyruvate mutase family protein [Pelagibacterales bacterium]|nr:isocitrate lyase/phosphoenolpyruvate mutase family protein [Pelagibacterales bacterium]